MPAKPTSTFTVESLRTTSEDLQKYAMEILVIADRMQLLEMPSLEITNNDQRMRALEYADNFATAARKALRDAHDLKFVVPGKPENPGGKRVRKSRKSADK